MSRAAENVRARLIIDCSSFEQLISNLFLEASARLPGWTRACTGRVWTAARVHESRRKKPWIRLACDPPLGSASQVPPRPAALVSPGVKGRRGDDNNDETVTSTTRTNSSSSVAVAVAK